MAQPNFGSKRVVVGAHYGLRDWLSQRITAALMTLFTLAVVVQVLLPGEMGYERWAGMFSAQWMNVSSNITASPSRQWYGWPSTKIRQRSSFGVTSPR